jgi:hypothetical protein
MGPREIQPEMPHFEWTGLPDNQFIVTPNLRECHWMQPLEGDIDTSHLYLLHGRLNPEDSPALGVYHQDKHPHLEIVHADYGIAHGASCDEDEATTYWRISQFGFPIFTPFPMNDDGGAPATCGLRWTTPTRWSGRSSGIRRKRSPIEPPRRWSSGGAIASTWRIRRTAWGAGACERTR